MSSPERREYEKVFSVQPRLITVDAPDGSGKGTITRVLADMLGEIHGADNVKLVSPTRFDQSMAAKAYEKRLKDERVKLTEVRHNSCFMAALAKNYETVITPELAAGKIVVVDSSEIRALAYIMDRGDEETVKSTCRWIANGLATHNIMAGNRVILEMSPEECLTNILTRGKADYGDPKTPEEAIQRRDAYYMAEAFVLGLHRDAEPNILRIDNERVDGNVPIIEFIHHFVGEYILPNLKF